MSDSEDIDDLHLDDEVHGDEPPSDSESSEEVEKGTHEYCSLLLFHY